jgi:hypothetical protein
MISIARPCIPSMAYLEIDVEDISHVPLCLDVGMDPNDETRQGLVCLTKEIFRQLTLLCPGITITRSF